MTRAEAEKELAELDPKEAKCWEVLSKLEANMNQSMANLEKVRLETRAQYSKEEEIARHEWSPLWRRKQQLKAFLEIAS